MSRSLAACEGAILLVDASQGIQAQTIHLYGNVEIAPATGVADAVVDLVDTGGTLDANGLVPIREIFSATARLIVNRASLKTKHEADGLVVVGVHHEHAGGGLPARGQGGPEEAAQAVIGGEAAGAGWYLRGAGARRRAA